MDTSNETSLIDNSENLHKTPDNSTLPVTQDVDNLEIFGVGPTSAPDTTNSAALVDFSFLDLSSSAPQEPEETAPEPEPVQSGTDQLLDFLS